MHTCVTTVKREVAMAEIERRIAKKGVLDHFRPSAQFRSEKQYITD